MELRLVYKSRDHYPHAIYSGTTIQYALQVREGPGEPWVTCPSVMVDDLPIVERDELYASQKRDADSAEPSREK